jgi:hypothetical protein
MDLCGDSRLRPWILVAQILVEQDLGWSRTWVEQRFQRCDNRQQISRLQPLRLLHQTDHPEIFPPVNPCVLCV